MTTQKLIPLIFLIIKVNPVLCQGSGLMAEQQIFQKQLLKTYQNLRATPTDRAALSKMESLPFFPFDSAFRVHAKLDTTTSAGLLEMKTSRGHVALYRRVGDLIFSIKGQSFRRPVYQAKAAAESKSDELFFPFTDTTNGETTYGGGRYIDLHMPQGSDLILDFNRAFNPYCAYSHVYSCEIPPADNRFQIPVEAGIKY